MKPHLKFREDRTFKIVQFTDLHWQNGEERDQRTAALMERALQEERPDLVVFTGDLIYSKDCLDPLASIRSVVSVVDRSETPWAAVFGNHDDENGVSRERLMEELSSHPLCLAERGPATISGVGNYILDIYGSHDDRSKQAILYFLDSGSYAPAPIGGYAWIQRDQINWYTEQSATRSSRDQEPYAWPALAFFHIPLPEYKDVWEQGECIGSKQENVCSSAVNSGFFAAMLEMGDVMGTFVGHDHINDYIGEHYGIQLGYGRASGYSTYGKEGFPRGARVIRLFEGERRFDTWTFLDTDAGV